jgi:hypothetical protein
MGRYAFLPFVTMEYTVYSNNQGCGYISNNGTDIIDFVSQVDVTINNKMIKPGELTDLDGYFLHPIKYMGIKKESDSIEMIFEMGHVTDLFGSMYYYQLVFKIDENRIFEMFSWQAGRDHFFKNGKWV